MTDARDGDDARPPAELPVGAPDERLARLVSDYARLIRHVIRRVGGREAAPMAEDIEQVVLVSLWQQVQREQKIDHPASYVYRAAVRETIRALNRERARVDRTAVVHDAIPAAPAAASPHEAAERRQRHQILSQCLEELLPDRARAVRAHLAGFAVGEIMDLFGWPYQRARNLVARGMADLRVALRKRGLP